MKETNVWLSPKELQHMLQGSLQWMDVATRVTTSKNGIRKLGEDPFKKESTAMQTVQPTDYPPREKGKPPKPLEGQPVIWLLGSVGLLTLSSWFYYVIFTN